MFLIYFCINDGIEIDISEWNITPLCEQYYSGLLLFIIFIYVLENRVTCLCLVVLVFFTSSYIKPERDVTDTSWAHLKTICQDFSALMLSNSVKQKHSLYSTTVKHTMWKSDGKIGRTRTIHLIICQCYFITTLRFWFYLRKLQCLAIWQPAKMRSDLVESTRGVQEAW